MSLRVSKRVVAPGAQVGVSVTVEPLREGVNDDEFLYFAYGSNMQYQRLKDRVRNLRKVSKVFAPNYKLRTNKIGDDGSGKANIESDEKSLVWGVLWAIPKTSQTELDKAEGYYQGRHDSHYKHENIIVFDEGHVPWKAMTYIACNGRIAEGDLPVNLDYYNFIVEGARENKLTKEYIEQIEKIRTQ